MPYKPAHPCKHPGCPGLTHGEYCDKHAPLYPDRKRRKYRLKDPRPSIYARKGYGPDWRRIRLAFLKAHPICEYCGRQKATQVHHILAVREGGTYEEHNLEACCQTCHNRERKGLRRIVGRYDPGPEDRRSM